MLGGQGWTLPQGPGGPAQAVLAAALHLCPYPPRLLLPSRLLPSQGWLQAIFSLPQHSQVEGSSHLLKAVRQSRGQEGRQRAQKIRANSLPGPIHPDRENRSRPGCLGAWNLQACPQL